MKYTKRWFVSGWAEWFNRGVEVEAVSRIVRRGLITAEEFQRLWNLHDCGGVCCAAGRAL